MTYKWNNQHTVGTYEKLLLLRDVERRATPEGPSARVESRNPATPPLDFVPPLGQRATMVNLAAVVASLKTPLPSISSQVPFTHSSLVGARRQSFEASEDLQILDYERLEVRKEPYRMKKKMISEPWSGMVQHWGDAVVGFAAARLLHQRFPRITPGAATVGAQRTRTDSSTLTTQPQELRKALVCNETLAMLSARYGLHERLEAAPEQLPALRSNPDVRADLFEAYIGALYDEHGADAADQFLSAVFEQLATVAYASLKAQYLPVGLLIHPDVIDLLTYSRICRLLSRPQARLPLSPHSTP